MSKKLLVTLQTNDMSVFRVGPPEGFVKGLQWKSFMFLGRTMPYVIKKGCFKGHFTKYLAKSGKNFKNWPFSRGVFGKLLHFSLFFMLKSVFFMTFGGGGIFMHV